MTSWRRLPAQGKIRIGRSLSSLSARTAAGGAAGVNPPPGRPPQPSGRRQPAVADLAGDLRRGVVEQDGALLLAALAHGHLAALLFLVADHQQIRHLLQLAVADPPAHALAAVVEVGADARLEQRAEHLVAVGGVPVGDRDDERLDRRQPRGQVAAVVLQQDAHEALDAPQQRAVDHDGPMLFVVGPGVRDVEALRHGEVDLDGAALPGAPHDVADVEVDLGAVEGAVAGVQHVGEGLAAGARLGVEHAGEGALGPLPHLVAADALVGPGAELDLDIAEAEGRVAVVHEAYDAADLVFELLGGAVDVRVVLGEVTHAEEAVKHAAHLVPVNAAELGHAQRQVAVGAPAALVDEQAAGAVHGLHGVGLLVDLGEVHVVLVVVPVAAALPELAAQDHRRADLLVTGAHVLGAPEVDHRVPETHALGVEEGEAGALLVEAEEIEVAADAPVVAQAGQFEGLEVRGQLLLGGEGRAVHAGEHGLVLVAAPVGAGQAGELEGAVAQPAGAGQVRPAAEVDEVALGVDADGLLAGEVLDELDLERLVRARAGRTGCARRPEDGQRLGARQLGARHRQVLAHDPGHLLLDTPEVGVGDGLGGLEVVVEAVLDGGADGVLRAREQAQDGLRHDVRRGVPQHVDGFGVIALERDDVDAVAVVQRGGDVDEAGDVGRGGGGHTARDGGFRQSRADRRRRIEHGRAVGEFQGGAIGEGDLHGDTGPLRFSRPLTFAGAVDRWSLAARRTRSRTGTASRMPRAAQIAVRGRHGMGGVGADGSATYAKAGGAAAPPRPPAPVAAAALVSAAGPRSGSENAGRRRCRGGMWGPVAPAHSCWPESASCPGRGCVDTGTPRQPERPRPASRRAGGAGPASRASARRPPAPPSRRSPGSRSRCWWWPAG